MAAERPAVKELVGIVVKESYGGRTRREPLNKFP